MAESVAMALAAKIGKQAAHKCVEEASRKAIAEKRSLFDVLAADQEVARHLTSAELNRLMEPMNYQGAAQTYIDRLIGAAQARGGKR
jgi:3-carboxy-cis,cis-muconate cycloisomerase